MRDLCPLGAPLDVWSRFFNRKWHSRSHNAAKVQSDRILNATTHTHLYAVGSRGGPNFQSFQFRSTRARSRSTTARGALG